MSTSSTPEPSGAVACGPLAEAMVNLYADGELDESRHDALHAHLDACPACREQLDALLLFRRALREEPLAVPPALDAAILARATATRQRPAPYTAARRADDRHPLRNARRRQARVRFSVFAAVVVIAVGAWWARPEPAAEAPIVQQRGQVEAEAEPAATYVIYPGLTVEENRGEEAP